MTELLDVYNKLEAMTKDREAFKKMAFECDQRALDTATRLDLLKQDLHYIENERKHWRDECEKLRHERDESFEIIKKMQEGRKETISWEPPLEIQLEQCAKTKDRISNEKQKLREIALELIKKWDALGDYKDDDFGEVGEVMEKLRKELA